MIKHRVLSIGLVLLTALFLPSMTVLSKDGNLRVASVELEPKLFTLQENRVKSLIPIKEGDVFSTDKLESARQTLLDTRLFSRVETSSQIKGGKVFVRLIVEEAWIVRKIDLSGHYPYLSVRILRLSALQAGDPFDDAKIRESEQRIVSFFEEHGFYGTLVTIETYFHHRHHVVNLKIRVRKGATYRLGKVDFTGNHFYQKDYLRNKLDSFFRFRIKRIENELKGLQNSYIKKGFVRARVKLLVAEPDPKKKVVNLQIEVMERKRLKLKFEGNRWFSPQTLGNYVTFYRERSYGRFAVDRSINKLLDFYRINGFLNSKIEAAQSKKDGEVLVTFFISEGPRIRLKKIELSGNQSISDKELLRVMENEQHTLTKQGLFKDDAVQVDLEKIIAHYINKGFFDARIVKSNILLNKFSDQAQLSIQIDEGKPYSIESITINGTVAFDSEFMLKRGAFQTGKFFDHHRLTRSIEKLTATYHHEGYPYFEVEVTKEVDSESHKVQLELDVNEGGQVRIGDILVSGEYSTRESVVRKALKFKEGDIYNYKKVLDAQLNLKRLGIFDHVRITVLGLEDQKEVVAVVVKVQERKSVTFDIQSGFDSDKLASGQIIATKRNIFGSAKQFQLRGLGGFERDRGEINLFSPRVFGASWNLLNQLFVEYEDDENFNAFSYGTSTGTLKHFGPDWTLLLKGEVSRFNIFESESNQAALRQNLFDNTFLELSASAAYDTRDNYADPQKGIYTIGTVNFNTDLADAETNFLIARFNGAQYYGLVKRFTLINNLRVSKLFRISKASRIPANKLFFLGGNDTVRGFDEDAINTSGGTTSLIYNAELNLRLIGSFKIAGFFDAGSLTETFSQFSTSSFRESAGFGIRYITPVGPIRLDYGFILDKRQGEKDQRFHFSFGHFF